MASTVNTISSNMSGGHLYSDSVDGWAFPKPIAYDTNSAGEGEINVQAKQHVLAQSDDTDAKPAVEGHCIVLHGASPGDMGARVAIGKIVKNGEKFTAQSGNILALPRVSPPCRPGHSLSR